MRRVFFCFTFERCDAVNCPGMHVEDEGVNKLEGIAPELPGSALGIHWYQVVSTLWSSSNITDAPRVDAFFTWRKYLHLHEDDGQYYDAFLVLGGDQSARYCDTASCGSVSWTTACCTGQLIDDSMLRTTISR